MNARPGPAGRRASEQAATRHGWCRPTRPRAMRETQAPHGTEEVLRAGRERRHSKPQPHHCCEGWEATKMGTCSATPLSPGRVPGPGDNQQPPHDPTTPPQPHSPDSATSAMGTPCSPAMKPRMEKMAKPATKLVPLLRKQRATQSLEEGAQHQPGGQG